MEGGDFDFDRVGRTLLSVAFDLDLTLIPILTGKGTTSEGEDLFLFL